VSGETGAKAPAPPFNVTATPGDSQITISWAPVTDAIFYNIYWGAAAGVTTSSTKIPKISGPFIHDKLTNGTNYFYIVTAENAVGEGELSDEVSATPMQ
ncbi:MAG: fibronectin type III domain-containing protein, partial [bacterium]